MDNGLQPLASPALHLGSECRLPPLAILTDSAEAKPSIVPRCPAGDCGWETRWRGPHPKLGETMVEYHRDADLHMRIARGLRHRVDKDENGKPLRDKDGNLIVLWRLAVAAERERDEMYALVDVLHDRPLWLPHRKAWLWQPALCRQHEADHKAAWYEATYPPNPELPSKAPRRRGRAKPVNEDAEDDGVPF